MNPLRVKQFFQAITGVGFSLTIYAFLDAAKTKKVQEEINQVLTKTAEETLATVKDTNQRIATIENKIENSRLTLQELFNKLNEGQTVPQSEAQKKLDDAADTVLNALYEIKEVVKDQKNNFIGTDLTDFFQKYIADFNLYLSTLSVEEILNLANILGIVFIILSLFSIGTLFFGNSAITYFELERRLPWLKKFIELRFKFTKYSVALNIFFIFIVLFTMLYINIYAFLL